MKAVQVSPGLLRVGSWAVERGDCLRCKRNAKQMARGGDGVVFVSWESSRGRARPVTLAVNAG